MTTNGDRTDKGTLKRDPNAPKKEPATTPEERAARIAEARARAAAAKAAGGSAAEPPAQAAAQPAPAPVLSAAAPAASAAPAGDGPRTAKGTLKRDPDAPKREAAATPEERAARIAEARAKAAAAKATGGSRPATSVTTAQPVAAADGGGTIAPAAPVAGDGLLRTAKGTIKRDPDAPKREPAATPEERAARIAEAKAKAAAAKQAAASGATAGLQPAAAAAAASNVTAAPAGGVCDADRAERRRVFEIVTRPVAGAQPVLRSVVSARSERTPPRGEQPMTESMAQVERLFRAALPGISVETLTSPLDVVFVVDRADLFHVLRTVRDHQALQMNYLRCVSGVDQLDEGIEVVYHLKSITTKHHASVKTLLPPRDLLVDSVTPLWPAANWHERELMEMFGVVCRGHPDPRNLLLDEDLTIHPLLKAHPLADIELKQGVHVF